MNGESVDLFLLLVVVDNMLSVSTGLGTAAGLSASFSLILLSDAAALIRLENVSRFDEIIKLFTKFIQIVNNFHVSEGDSKIELTK